MSDEISAIVARRKVAQAHFWCTQGTVNGLEAAIERATQVTPAEFEKAAEALSGLMPFSVFRRESDKALKVALEAAGFEVVER